MRRNPPQPAQAPEAVQAGAPIPPPLAAPMTPASSDPVYRNPKIGMVYLRAHQDAEGRLLGPQVMYQVIDPGGWNLDAVEQGNGYIPAANLEIPPDAGSPYVVPARAIGPVAPDSPLLDPVAAEHVVITGLMRSEDKPEAEAMARQQGVGSSAVYDEQAGWLLLPPRKTP